MKKYCILYLLLFMLVLVGCDTPTMNNIKSIVIDLDSIEIEVGEDAIIPIIYDGKGDYSDLVFTIGDESIVTVDNNFITGVDSGITTLTVSSKEDNSISDSIYIFVNPENFDNQFVRLVSEASSLNIGKSMKIYVDNFKSLNATSNDDFMFFLSDPEVLRLNDDHTVTALKEGVCTIEAREIKYPGNIGKITVYVGLQSEDKTRYGEPDNTPLIAYFEDNNYVIDCNTDEQIQILGANNYQRYVYSTEDENILLISDTGLFMGVTEGEVNVTISSRDTNSSINKATLKIKVTGDRKRDYAPILLKIALAEEGYREWTGSNDTKYGEWNNCNYEEWCATFVSWCLNNAGVPKDICIRSIAVRIFEGTYRDKGQFFLKEEYKPQPADLIIFSSKGASHIGIVVSSDDYNVYTIEGNTGNMVAQRTYPLDYEQITGYVVLNFDE